ncbi:response regulator [Mucilaginibacter boryungensis]|uniref:Response regulator n=1 Tax=Mucilaginibacter boryungensis TaxID=768480 RepID=A0ABR9XKE3_9SPHI|nr:response regulator [Mucilaginibacter boryungensis]MBE9667848.1 response regulator [Mucilaginibacter boryungensis]
MAKKILVIEDDRDIRETITYALEESMFDVVASEDSKILKSIHKIKPDLILLDNWLTDWKSDANGQQISKELKTNPDTKHIPIIIVSAVSNIREVADAGQADGFLRKPFDLNDLIAIINKHVL